MIVVPAVSPEIDPVTGSMVATKALLLAQLPPDRVLLIGVELPTQILVTPLIAVGVGCTLIVFVVRHPVGNVYVITAMPSVIPFNRPSKEPTVAMAGLPLLHNPLPAL